MCGEQGKGILQENSRRIGHATNTSIYEDGTKLVVSDMIEKKLDKRSFLNYL